MRESLRIEPATPERWRDVERLFGARGACGGCWCMWWRRARPAFLAGKGEGNRRALRRLVQRGCTPGLLAYAGDVPIGWCALAPRSEFPRLQRSRNLQPIDAEPVWSVVCFFVERGCRRQGVSVQLLRAAVGFAADRGAHIVEGYPVQPRGGRTADAFAYTGLVSAFRRAGFRLALARSERQWIMRADLPPRRAPARRGLPGTRRKSSHHP